ncbi:ScbR family autoregulator-binding transcription factor [Streptomyces sp. NRRL B-1347]|uniref:ScbR family autoregulator-binding transcription factor n=1 Tax=Streptomyces sp. NRRL B-1347 TaxID=1476877 RepID=UPI0004C4CC43|nr:ScbR family autoregulator-binding transcription factor [Streptomyces sp. NRRL B-1347]
MVRQERAVRTRQKILVAAAEVFDRVGYDAATISEILKRSGVTKGALYFHFASKEELAQAVLANQMTALRVPEQDLIMQEGLDASLLLAHLLYLHEPMVRGSVRLTVEQGALQSVLDRRVPMQAWISHNTALLARAKAAGELLPHVDVDVAARMFIGAFTGAQVLSKIMTDHADIVESATEVLQHLLASIMVPGVLVRMDFSRGRAARVYEAAMALHQEQEEPEPAHVG